MNHKKLKIVHITKYLSARFGGIERVTAEMAEAGTMLGHEITIIGIDDTPLENPFINIPGVSLIRYPLNFQIGPAPISWSLASLANDLKDADLIHIHLPNPAAELALIAARLVSPQVKHIPLVPVAHAGITRWPLIARIWETTFQRLILHQSRNIIAAAPQIFTAFAAYQKFHQKAQILPFPTPDPESFPDHEESSTPEILALGRLVPYKGFSVLIDALTQVPDQWRLTIIGSGPLFTSLTEQIIANGLQHRIEIASNLTDSERNFRLARSDFVVVPSTTKAEAYGMVIAEAFSYGKPVITTSIQTGMAFLSRHGECGATVPPFEKDALASAIKKLLSDQEHLTEIGRKNYKFWSKNLTQIQFCENYRQFIESITKSKSISPAKKSA